jgi:hypothetical protein
MSEYQAQNYFKQGDQELVIGGKLTVEAGATFDGIAKVETQAAIADLDQTIGGSYVQAEVQAISDKMDALLAALRSAEIIAAS